MVFAVGIDLIAIIIGIENYASVIRDKGIFESSVNKISLSAYSSDISIPCFAFPLTGIHNRICAISCGYCDKGSANCRA